MPCPGQNTSLHIKEDRLSLPLLIRDTYTATVEKQLQKLDDSSETPMKVHKQLQNFADSRETFADKVSN